MSKMRLDSENKKHLDAVAGDGSGYFFEKELEAIDNEMYEVIEKDLDYALDIPVNTSKVEEGAQSYTYKILDKVGICKLIEDYADDIPTAEVIGEEVTVKVHSFATGYQYSELEIMSAAKAGRPLERDKAFAAIRASEERNNELAYLGELKVNRYGLINNPNIGSFSVPNGAGASPLWSNKTAEEILDDVKAARTYIIKASKGKVRPPFNMILPWEQHSLISSLNYNPGASAANSGIITVLQAIENLGITVEPRSEMELAFVNGTKDGFLLYKKDRRFLEYLVAMPIKSYPVQRKNFVYQVPMMMRAIGTIIRYPIAFRIGTGI